MDTAGVGGGAVGEAGRVGQQARPLAGCCGLPVWRLLEVGVQGILQTQTLDLGLCLWHPLDIANSQRAN